MSENILDYKRDMQNALDTAADDRGKEKDIQFIKNAITEGFDNVMIARLTDLSIEQVDEIRKKINKNL